MPYTSVHSSEQLAGVSAIMPLVIAAIPFGVVFGALASAQGMPEWVALSLSAMVFAGASQFIALTLLANDASWPVIVLTVGIVNLRHLLYALSMVPLVREQTLLQRCLMGFWLTDESFAVTYQRYQQHPRQPIFHFYLGGGGFMYLAWVLSTVVGIYAGQWFDGLADWGLEIAMVVAFVGIVIPQLTLPSHWLCALTAAIGAILFYDLPHQLGIVVTVIGAVAVGVITEQGRPPRTAT
ncbi:AzlC family ABC transporter permease [Aestuariibacter halophilus]|uniref:AzlC family ABC transporter permease n=1 Tax=Fluctibacter halophilus TaxID=226011 RepID=A0ABS8G3S1_9ALTE|nr:AzlC family ABC transporter permease [Aestuariibacter halophilus]MCC2615239.1 AzlC family ABC transporter permease [Aestuariibacter halophilus]